MKDREKIEVLILRIGDKYLQAPIKLKITIGEIIAGNIELKKGDEHN